MLKYQQPYVFMARAAAGLARISSQIARWRASLAASDRPIMAVVTDDVPPMTMTTLARSDVNCLVDWVLEMFPPACS
jgi:hypothetical protein